jgi:hypothetical protein
MYLGLGIPLVQLKWRQMYEFLGKIGSDIAFRIAFMTVRFWMKFNCLATFQGGMLSLKPFLD